MGGCQSADASGQQRHAPTNPPVKILFAGAASEKLGTSDDTPHAAILMLGASSMKHPDFAISPVKLKPREISLSTLLNAAELGRTSVVRRYVEGGGDLNAVNEDGDSLVMYAAGTGNVHLLVYLLDACPRLVSQPNATGLTPMHIACMQGFDKVVVELLAFGSPVEFEEEEEVYDTVGEAPASPLEMCCMGGHMKVARLLLQHGAQLSGVKDLGMREMLAPHAPAKPSAQAAPAEPFSTGQPRTAGPYRSGQSPSALANQCSCMGCTGTSAYVALPCCHQMCATCLAQALPTSQASDAAVKAYEAEQFGPGNKAGMPEGRRYLSVCPVCCATGKQQQLVQSHGVVMVMPK